MDPCPSFCTLQTWTLGQEPFSSVSFPRREIGTFPPRQPTRTAHRALQICPLSAGTPAARTHASPFLRPPPACIVVDDPLFLLPSLPSTTFDAVIARSRIQTSPRRLCRFATHDRFHSFKRALVPSFDISNRSLRRVNKSRSNQARGGSHSQKKRYTRTL